MYHSTRHQVLKFAALEY